VWEVINGRLEIAPETLGGDAVSVLHLDATIPTYFEMQATINAGKPTGGFKSNAYFIFDYRSASDFKFAGIDISNDKLEMGHRDASGWHVLDQDNARLKPDKDYHVLLAINGTVATLVVDGSEIFHYTFDPYVDADGDSWGLNAGMVGLGAENSIARIDNVAIQVLPPEITLEQTNEFDHDPSALFAEHEPVGAWKVDDGHYKVSSTSAEAAYSIITLPINSNAMLTLSTTLNTTGMSGFIFDQYSADDYKFVALSALSGELVIGHYTAKGGLVIDNSTDSIMADDDHELKIVLKGSTVSVELDNQVVLGHAFNAVVVDGAYGLYHSGGAANFDTFTMQTNDRAYEGYADLLVTSEPGSVNGNVADLTDAEIPALFAEAKNRWIDHLGYDPLSALDITVVIADLGGLALGKADGTITDGFVITVDINAARHGWFVDLTPEDDLEFAIVNGYKMIASEGSDAYGKIDLLTVLMHELGHVIDQEHMSEGVMSNSLSVSTRYLIAENEAADSTQDTEPTTITSTYTSSDGAVGLNDNGTTTSTIEITDAIVIEDLNIQLDISHSRDADLTVYLVAADGTEIQLFSDVSGSYGFTDTLLDDDASTDVSAAGSGGTTYQPSGDLSSVEGMLLTGTWTLVVVDDRKGRSGMLNSWSLIVEHT
jgi:subtilisin-like proprotein convertase family protein